MTKEQIVSEIKRVSTKAFITTDDVRYLKALMKAKKSFPTS